MFSVCLDDIIDIGVGGGGASSSYNANYQFARKKFTFSTYLILVNVV